MTDDLTIDELWKTYPVQIKDPNPNWLTYMKVKETGLRTYLKPGPIRSTTLDLLLCQI